MMSLSPHSNMSQTFLMSQTQRVGFSAILEILSLQPLLPSLLPQPETKLDSKNSMPAQSLSVCTI